jgi:esterase/lipase superfamily enzyme
LKEAYIKDYSPTLNRDMEMLVFGERGLPLLLFPTSMGKYYQNKDFGLIDAVRPLVEEGHLRIYCVDSIDSLSWYNKGVHPAERVQNHLWYERYLLAEVLPRMVNGASHQRVMVGGCSFGAYHASNLAFRHPERFSYLLNMGGAFDIKMLMGGYYDDNFYFNNPPDYLPDANHPALWHLGIVMGVGEHDFCLPANLHLHQVLANKGIEAWLDVRAGQSHDWPVWRDMFATYCYHALRQQHLV